MGKSNPKPLRDLTKGLHEDDSEEAQQERQGLYEPAEHSTKEQGESENENEEESNQA